MKYFQIKKKRIKIIIYNNHNNKLKHRLKHRHINYHKQQLNNQIHILIIHINFHHINSHEQYLINQISSS
jgi:hypothetical protein